MGDPNPNHFLVHSALVLPPLVVQGSSCEAGEKIVSTKIPVRPGIAEPTETTGIDLPILGWLDKNVGFHRSSSSWCSSGFRTLFGVTFSEKLYETRKRDTHTHIGSSVFNNLSLSPEPLAPPTCEKKHTAKPPKKHALFRWDNWSAIALICWSFLPCVVPVSLVWLHRLRRLPLGALRWPLLVEKVPW